MSTHTWQEFNHLMLKKLQFIPIEKEHCTLYMNPSKPSSGFFLHYHRPSYYEFIIGDYTIPSDFEIIFHQSETVMRFGTVFQGTSHFKLNHEAISAFTPSSFFVIEKEHSGTQVWHAHQHLHGAEMIIHEAYLKEVLNPFLSQPIDLQHFKNNFTYNYLPIEIAKIVNHLHGLGQADELTKLYLESQILACMAILIQEIEKGEASSFNFQLHLKELTIGAHHKIRFTTQDLKAIYKAHAILTKEAYAPPTIKALSQRVLLNEQKLKAGFLHQYHMTIHQYTTSLRMTTAANLLTTTDESIETISQKVGYAHPSSFIKCFKQTYGKTPLQFKKGGHE